jgi:hypothetical protein
MKGQRSMKGAGNRSANGAAPAAPMRRAVAATVQAGSSQQRLRELRAEILAVYAELSAALLARNRRRK